MFHNRSAVRYFYAQTQYRTLLLRNEERFFISDEICQGGLSMPNPTQISLLNYHFEAATCDAVLTVMLNKSDRDYSTPDELNHATELTQFSYEEIRDALNELHRRGFLLEVKKPYGYVYAVNKLRISNMEFVYGT